jgi:hypothetical protein
LREGEARGTRERSSPASRAERSSSSMTMRRGRTKTCNQLQNTGILLLVKNCSDSNYLNSIKHPTRRPTTLRSHRSA